MRFLLLAAIVAGLFDATPCRAQAWTELTPIADSVLKRWKGLVADDNAWRKTSSFTDEAKDSTWTINCAEVRSAAAAALSADDFYWGTNVWYAGEHTPDHKIYLDKEQHESDRHIFETVLHESMHHAGQRHGRPGHWEPEHYAAIKGCHGYALEEEEEDDEDPCGDGADCGGGDPTPTEPVCKEVQVPEVYTEWERKWRQASVCFGPSPEVRRFCTTVGRFVWVQVQKVRLRTQTVCEQKEAES